MIRQLEPCESCGDDTAAGTPLYSGPARGHRREGPADVPLRAVRRARRRRPAPGAALGRGPPEAGERRRGLRRLRSRRPLTRASGGRPGDSATRSASTPSPSSPPKSRPGPSRTPAPSGRSSSVMSDQRNRTRIGMPLNVSSPMNVPTPSSKPPMTGGSMWCGLRPSSHQIAHCLDLGVVGPDRDRAVRAVGVVEDVVVDVAEAAHRRLGDGRALELPPGVAPGEPLDELVVVDAPRPEVEVEVVGRVVIRGVRARGEISRGCSHRRLLARWHPAS